MNLKTAQANVSIAVLLLALCSVATAAPVYHLIDLGTLNSGYTFPGAINNSGAIVGEGKGTGAFSHGFYWPLGGPIEDIGTLPSSANESQAYGINDAGIVVGRSFSPSAQAIRWTHGGTLQIIPGLPGSTGGVAYGINNVNQVTGYSVLAGVDRAVRWSATDVAEDLGEFAGGFNYSRGYGINLQGQVVGESGAATGLRAFLWTEGVGMLNLGDLPGGNDQSSARAINDQGQVVGKSFYRNGILGHHAFLWTTANGMTDLGDLFEGTDASEAYDINNAGDVVGWSGPLDAGGSGTGPKASLWSADGGRYLLNDLSDASGTGWNLLYAISINEGRQIAAYGNKNGSSTFHAVLLTPVPEPSILVLVLTGMMTSGIVVWRRSTNRMSRV